MKQQDRLEEREQDIEEQLYKLESDKRLVEVGSAGLLPGAQVLAAGLGCCWAGTSHVPVLQHFRGQGSGGCLV